FLEDLQTVLLQRRVHGVQLFREWLLPAEQRIELIGRDETPGFRARDQSGQFVELLQICEAHDYDPSPVSLNARLRRSNSISSSNNDSCSSGCSRGFNRWRRFFSSSICLDRTNSFKREKISVASRSVTSPSGGCTASSV